MIDFKYHVVSIVAVFLALAVGIVLGTNVLSGDVLQNLKTQTSDLRKQAQDLRTQIQTQQSQISDDENFAAALEPTVVADRLAGSRVAVVTVPDAPKALRDRTVKTLTAAGAVVTAQIAINAAYDDPAQATALSALLKSLDAKGFDPAGGVAAQAASVLASALVGQASRSGASEAGASAAGSPTPGSPAPVSPVAAVAPSPTSSAKSAKPVPSVAPKPPAGPTVTPSTVANADDAPRNLAASSIEVLAGLQKAGFVSFDQQPTTYADMVVVVSPAAPAKAAKATPTPTPSPAPDSALLDVVAALQRAGSKTVLVGPAGSADPGGLVASLRSNASLAKVVSAVDDIDSASGRIAMVFALSVQKDGVVGQYGTGQGAAAPLPTATPAAANP